MTRVANDRFVARQGWWTTQSEGLFAEAPTVASGYVRHRVTTGAGAGAFWFNTDNGPIDKQIVIGDFDVIADLQCLNSAETDLPVAAGAHMYCLCAHHPVQIEDFAPSGWAVRHYYHRGIGYAPGMTSTARMMSEFKSTVESVSTWETFDGLVLGDAAALGGAFNATGARWWIRVQRVGNTFSSWDIAIQSGDRVPTTSDTWINQHTVVQNDMPPVLWVGLHAYSSQVSADVAGRCRAFLNIE